MFTHFKSYSLKNLDGSFHTGNESILYTAKVIGCLLALVSVKNIGFDSLSKV